MPLTDITLFHHSSDHETPLSRCLQTNGLVATHNHNWLFCHGAGNGIQCALGNGRDIESAAKSPEFALLIAMLHKFREYEFRDKLLTNIFDPKTAYIVRVLPNGLATNSLSDRSTLREWIAAETPFFDERLTEARR